MNDTIQALHNEYTNLTKIPLILPVGMYWLWEAFIAHKHTIEDLRIVVKHLKRGIKNNERHSGCLKLTNLIGDLDGFAQELAMAQKEFRVAPAYSKGKQQALRATGRDPSPPQTEAELAGLILERTKLASMLHAWKATL